MRKSIFPPLLLVASFLCFSIQAQDNLDEIPWMATKFTSGLPIVTTIYPYDGFNQTSETFTIRAGQGSYAPFLVLIDHDPYSSYSIFVDIELVHGDIWQNTCDPMITYFDENNSENRFVLRDDYEPDGNLYPRYHGNLPSAPGSMRTYCVEGYSGSDVYCSVILSVKHTLTYYSPRFSSTNPEPEANLLLSNSEKLKPVFQPVKVFDWIKKAKHK